METTTLDLSEVRVGKENQKTHESTKGIFGRNAIGDHSIMVICGHLVNSQLNLRKKRKRAKLKKEKRRYSVHLKLGHCIGLHLKHSAEVHGV